MKLNLLLIITTFFFFINADNSFAQSALPAPKAVVAAPPKATNYWERDSVKNNDPSLNGQYKFLLSRTRTSPEGYKLVNPSRMNLLWKNMNDTLRKERVERKGLQQKLIDQEKTISYLKTEISGKEASLTDNTNKLNEIVFLGVSFEKGTYNVIVWSIIALLTIALIVVIATSGKKILEAKHRIQLYDEISEEYQTFKSKTVEKERKLARELQDERNKLDDLLNKK